MKQAAELRKEASNVSQRFLKSRENKQNAEKYKINGNAFFRTGKKRGKAAATHQVLLRKIEECYKSDVDEVKYQVPETKLFTSEHFRVDDIADRLKRNQKSQLENDVGCSRNLHALR